MLCFMAYTRLKRSFIPLSLLFADKIITWFYYQADNLQNITIVCFYKNTEWTEFDKVLIKKTDVGSEKESEKNLGLTGK